MQTTYKVGDKVRILNAKKIMSGSRKWDDGDITTVDSLWSDGDPRLVITRGPEKGKAFVVDSSEFEYIEKVEESDAKMTQFKVGDKVRVINANASKHSNGDEGVVVSITPIWDVVFIDVDVNGVQQGHYAKDIELVSPRPTKNQRLITLEQKVEAMQAEIDALKAAQKVTAITPTITVKSEADISKIAEGFAKMVAKEKKLTPNEQRKAIIDEAKAFVEDALNRNYRIGSTPKIKTTSQSVWFVDYGNAVTDKAEFIVNSEKRIVVAIIRTINGKRVVHKGIAKCNPSDVFNADIGKAIALGRALGLDVSKFEKAVQPSEVVVGMNVVKTEGVFAKTSGNVYSVGDKSYLQGENGLCYKRESGDSVWAFKDDVKVIDDTEAQY